MYNIVLLKKADCLKDTLNIMILLRDDFRIGLATFVCISPMVAVLAWGETEAQYNYTRINNLANTEIIT